MKSLKLTLLIATAFTILCTQAQTSRSGNWCGFDNILQKDLDNNPLFLQDYFSHQQSIKNNHNNKKPGPYIIPVVVHNITHSGGVGYVSKATIEAAIDRLNIDFNRLNSDTTATRSIFKPYAGSMDIEFRLAHIDPNGDCTEGIVRIEHPESADFHDADKAISRWPVTGARRYFNIWLVDFITGSNPPQYIAGYAQFPWSGINNTYGVVIDNSFFGSNNRTLTHEVGHCLGLLHTFQSGCGGNCSSTGDGLCDTPPVANSTQSCNQSQNTCSNDASGPDPYNANVVDQIENYMSYDNCQNMFSIEQVARMESNLDNTNGLTQLVSATNLASTGVNNPYGPVICTPIADFSYSKEIICEGDSVTFTDDSYNANPTSWSWTFTGGTPSSSSDSMPTITYNTAGTYSVTHRPSTSTGTDSITKTSIITVNSLIADYISPVTDGFENTTQFNNDWIIGQGLDGFHWENVNTTSASGSRCLRLLNYSASSSASDVDYLISPSYDLSSSSNKQMRFKVAYANKNNGDQDKLFIYQSTNCGATWSLKTPIINSSLVTAPNHTNSFTPTFSEWVEKIIDFSSIGNTTNLRVKFEFTGLSGNNIYLDNINIGIPVSVDEFSNVANFTIYPNPTSSNATISFNLIKAVNNLSIKVRNTLGQTVTNIINGESFNIGKYTLNIDEGKMLSKGIYLIEFNADNAIKTQKLIIQ